MKAVVVEQTGGPEVLSVKDIPSPVPGSGEVLIDVAYSGCNWMDIQIRQGIYRYPVELPFILGSDISGVISAVGPDVQNVATGDRVVSGLHHGGYAEQCVSVAIDVVKLPKDMPFDVASAFYTQAMTAYHCLHTYGAIKPGDWVLAHAIGGGVGIYLTQLAKLAGAHIIGTVGTAGKETFPLQLGADTVVNLNEKDFVEVSLGLTLGRGIDITVDSLGDAVLDRSLDTMAELGKVISIGEAIGDPLPTLFQKIRAKSLTFTRFSMDVLMTKRADFWKRSVFDVCDLILSEQLLVPIVKTFGLADVADMHRLMETRTVSGKLLLNVRE